VRATVDHVDVFVAVHTNAVFVTDYGGYALHRGFSSRAKVQDLHRHSCETDRLAAGARTTGVLPEMADVMDANAPKRVGGAIIDGDY
jgi:hypothetical protein